MPPDADLVVVNTCAFIEEARQESIDTILGCRDVGRPGAELVVTGCMAERYGDELAGALPEVDAVAGFGVPVTIGSKPATGGPTCRARLRPARAAPTAVPGAVGLREDRRGMRPDCGFCAIPSLPGPAAIPCRSPDPRRGRGARRSERSCSSPRTSPRYGRDQGQGERSIVPLVAAGGRAGRPGPAALPLPVGPHRRADRHHHRHRRALLRPLAPARVAAAGAAHASVGRRLGVPRAHRRHPPRRARRGVPLQLHRRATRARPRRTTTTCSPSSRRRELDWCGFFAYSREDGHLRRRPRRQACRRRPGRPSGWPSCASCRTTSPPRSG